MGLFNIFGQNEQEKNKSHIKNLLEVALADGQLDKSELDVLISIAGKYDIPKTEVQRIIDNPHDVKFSPPSSYSAKVKLLEDLVKIMIADKNIDEEEVKICKDLALKLNIVPVIVDELIQSSLQ